MWDLVGKSFEMQAVRKPASERPKAAYQTNMLVIAIRNESERTYTESSAAGTNDDGVVGVINYSVVTNTTLALYTDTSVKICCVPSHKWPSKLDPTSRATSLHWLLKLQRRR